MADQRDGITWVALELTHQGEKLVEEGTLPAHLRRALGVDGSWPVFIPSRVFTKKGKKTVVHLMEGYAFVASGLDEVVYFRLEQTKLVDKVLSSPGPRGIRSLETLADREIAELRKKLTLEVSSDITPGMRVLVMSGVYSKLEGDVLDTEGDHAVLLFGLRSLQIIAKIPKVFLETV